MTASGAAERSHCFVLGAVSGRIEWSPLVLERSLVVAREHFARAEAEEFSGEQVEDILIPDWMPPVSQWLPRAELAAVGLALNERGRGPRLYATADIGPHLDNMDGLSLAVVLVNEGLTFIQGDQSHCARPGEWFVFDDFIEHEVRSTDTSGAYLVLTLALKETPASS